MPEVAYSAAAGVAHLANCPFFQGLDQVVLADLWQRATVRHVAAQGFFFVQDDRATNVYMLIAGHVHLTKLAESGQQIMVS
jgi:hypothetical protein